MVHRMMGNRLQNADAGDENYRLLQHEYHLRRPMVFQMKCRQSMLDSVGQEFRHRSFETKTLAAKL